MNQTHIAPFHFFKMDGTGNDFVIIDARARALHLKPEEILRLSGRANTITKGCDQLIVIEKSQKADCFMRIYNSDGSEVASCGNASRCIGWLMMKEQKKDTSTFETLAGLLTATRTDKNLIQVDMGPARTEWNEIPLAHQADTLHLPISQGPLSDPVGVSMGNPHAVFFVKDINTIDFKELGPALEHHALFPERANIGVAQIMASDTLRLRVFERGAGETLACGTGACAAVVAAARRKLAGRKASVELKGGTLEIEWMPNNRVMMSGPVKLQFEGTLELETHTA
ncbi:MAG: diaminopimelate epimerase [Proteobacteria bacterium]|nr:diaminopimelate epimerase [Pseudomonadota bacterium]